MHWALFRINSFLFFITSSHQMATQEFFLILSPGQTVSEPYLMANSSSRYMYVHLSCFIEKRTLQKSVYKIFPALLWATKHNWHWQCQNLTKRDHRSHHRSDNWLHHGFPARITDQITDQTMDRIKDWIKEKNIKKWKTSLPSLMILSPCWFLLSSSVVFCPRTWSFQGFIVFKGNSIWPQKWL